MGATNDSMSEFFFKCLHGEFDMSMIRELLYFLGVQIEQSPQVIYVHQSKYIKILLKKFGYENIKSKSTPMSAVSKLTIDEQGKCVDF